MTERFVTPEEMAQAFYEAHDRVAKGLGYYRYDREPVPWEEAPYIIRAMMIATIRNVLIEQGLTLSQSTIEMPNSVRLKSNPPTCPHCGELAPYGDERIIWLSVHESWSHRWWCKIKKELPFLT